MARTIVVCGYGPGISSALAQKFAREGFQVALVARSAERLEAGAAALREAGATARAFPCDLGDPAAVRALIADVREALGPVTVLHWNAYAGLAGDLTKSTDEELRTVLDVGVVGAVAAVQAALDDLRAQAEPAVLITGGGFAFYNDHVDRSIVQWNAMGLGVTKAAQHKLTHLLHYRLKPEGIYVGSVVVLGLVKGSAFDQNGGGAGLDPNAIADAFWELYTGRREVTRNFG
ncbi:MAG: SDR family NAD(P)-dependent oxidoreductase [Myxococcales bacterium]|nr:SDR family NAD(P)-dependent oxidoreductase [Myxococcales bacterium]